MARLQVRGCSARRRGSRCCQYCEPSIAAIPGVARVRSLGMIGAADLGSGGYGGRMGWRVYDEALSRGAYLRPLGDTVYLTPPLNIGDADLERFFEVLHDAISAALRA